MGREPWYRKLLTGEAEDVTPARLDEIYEEIVAAGGLPKTLLWLANLGYDNIVHPLDGKIYYVKDWNND